MVDDDCDETTTTTSLAVSLRPPRGVVKGVTGLWLLLSLTLASVYRGNLKAMLILPSLSLPFNSLEELSSSGLPVWVPLDSVLHLTAYVSTFEEDS